MSHHWKCSTSVMPLLLSLISSMTRRYCILYKALLTLCFSVCWFLAFLLLYHFWCDSVFELCKLYSDCSWRGIVALSAQLSFACAKEHHWCRQEVSLRSDFIYMSLFKKHICNSALSFGKFVTWIVLKESNTGGWKVSWSLAAGV